MDFLNVEYDLAKTKLASVRLTLDKLCKQCSRPIQDKVLFNLFRCLLYSLME